MSLQQNLQNNSSKTVSGLSSIRNENYEQNTNLYEALQQNLEMQRVRHLIKNLQMQAQKNSFNRLSILGKHIIIKQKQSQKTLETPQAQRSPPQIYKQYDSSKYQYTHHPFTEKSNHQEEQQENYQHDQPYYFKSNNEGEQQGVEDQNSNSSISSRELNILFNKQISNINYLKLQTKELMKLIHMSFMKEEEKELKNIITKMQIMCRRLRIQHRSISSKSIKQSSQRQRLGRWGKAKAFDDYNIGSPYQGQLKEKIKKEKIKHSNLSTRIIQLQNYLQIKNQNKSYISSNIQNSENNDQNIQDFEKDLPGYKYQQLLTRKINLLRQSIQQIKKHRQFKHYQNKNQVQILKEELQIINQRIFKINYRNKQILKVAKTNTSLLKNKSQSQRTILNMTPKSSASYLRYNSQFKPKQIKRNWSSHKIEKMFTFDVQKNKNYQERVSSIVNEYYYKDNKKDTDKALCNYTPMNYKNLHHEF